MKHNLFAAVRRLVIDQEGATASEYAVILGVIIVLAIGAAAVFGLNFASTTTTIYSGLSNGTDAAGGSFGPGKFRNNTTVAIP